MNTSGCAPAPEHEGAAVPEAIRSGRPPKDGLTMREAAQALGMSPRQVAALIEAGVIVPMVSARAGGTGFRPWTGGAH